jgi:NADH-quinone oxidoreductase subunit H
MEFFWATLIKIVVTLFWVMNLGAILTWVERKQSAVMQDRIGANRANVGPFRVFGLFQIAADSIKMLVKEDWIPPGGNRLLHTIAPMISVFFALMAFAVIPIGNTITIGGHQIPLYVVGSNVAILFVFAMLSLEIYGVVFAGYASDNNYSMLGGLRATAQMFSYEITFGATVVGLLMIYGSLDLQQLILAQKGAIAGFYPRWGLFLQPLGFLLFCTAGLAETKRAPFDLPEGESEIVGYFIEYSGMKFGLFLLTDFLESILIAALATILFLGGWQVPFLAQDGFHFGASYIAISPIWVTILQVIAFFAKLTIFLWTFMLIRWSLPRFRYDQLMRLGWQILLPLSLLNILLTGVILMLWDKFHG